MAECCDIAPSAESVCQIVHMPGAGGSSEGWETRGGQSRGLCQGSRARRRGGTNDALATDRDATMLAGILW